MATAAKRSALKPINISVFAPDLDLAAAVATRRERRVGTRTHRSDILREAIRRGLAAMDSEESGQAATSAKR